MATIYIAFAAMILRALLPVGWMPNTAGPPGTSITLCTIDGPIQIWIGLDGRPLKQKPAQDDGHHHDICPFGAAPHFATADPVLALTAPAVAANFVVLAVRSGLVGGIPRYSQQSPRAPPFLV